MMFPNFDCLCVVFFSNNSQVEDIYGDSRYFELEKVYDLSGSTTYFIKGAKSSRGKAICGLDSKHAPKMESCESWIFLQPKTNLQIIFFQQQKSDFLRFFFSVHVHFGEDFSLRRFPKTFWICKCLATPTNPSGPTTG